MFLVKGFALCQSDFADHVKISREIGNIPDPSVVLLGNDESVPG